jgi:D-aminoacyl-tRNA deacylase
MRAVVQRVRGCSVKVGERQTGEIGTGVLVYLGVGKSDTERDAQVLCDKVMNLRIFPDENGKMNLSVRDVVGGVMVVSQFTLFGDARDGRRPSYTEAADPQKARVLYDAAVDLFRASGIVTACGEFQTMMEVSYTNMGPVTILLDSEKRF